MQAMKAVLWAVLIFAFIGAFYVIWMAMAAKPGHNLGFAVGAPNEDGQVRAQVQITTWMKMQDFIPITPEGSEDWDKWMNDHFQITNTSGTVLTGWQRLGIKTADVPEGNTGTVEFVIGIWVDAGQDYMLTYTPIMGEPLKYEYVFKGEPQEFMRVRVETIE